MNIALIGAGMGSAGTMTLEAHEALSKADAVIGAGRLLSALPDGIRAEKFPQALPEKIADIVREHPEWQNACVALSGDVGFYSGARRLLELLKTHQTLLFPGISTPQYFAARLRRPWQDFRLVSAHGLHQDILAEALNHPTVFFLTDNQTTPSRIAETLSEAGLADARMTVGENLSSADERIVEGTAGELALGGEFSPLCAVLVDNDKTFTRGAASPGIADDDFIRGNAPMTKREIRVQALSLLALRPEDTAYDVGAGTGSVAVEMALLTRRGRVYAVENDPDAFGLLQKNREKFGVYNLCPVPGTAPEALETLPPPAAVFIGGSKGRMRGIIEAALSKNPRVRVVASAVALETLTAAMTAMQDLSLANVEAVQIAANRTVLRGGYHMLEARNPVFLISGGGE